MKRNNLYLLIVLILFLAIAAYFYFSQSDSTYGDKQAGFAIGQNEAIDRIVLSGKSDTVTLAWKFGAWKVNELYTVKQEALINLSKTLVSVKIKAPVTRKNIAQVINKMSDNTVKVELWTKGKKIKSYIVAKGSERKLTYMLMEGEGQPFIVEIPGYAGIIADIYSLDEWHWKSNIIFQYFPEQIARIHVEYKNVAGNSFFLRKEKERFTLSTSDGEVHTNLNRETLKQYLMYFAAVKFLRRVKKHEELIKDSLDLVPPEQVVTVKDVEGYSISVKTYRMPTKKSPNATDQITFDLDHSYAIINEKDLVIINNSEFDLLLKEPVYFIN